MSTNLIIGGQNSSANQPDYGYFGPFASQTEAISTSSDAFSHILSFLEPKDLACSERVCRSWNRFIHSTDLWKRQCQIRLGIPAATDPKGYLPKCPSYKKSLQLISSSILDGSVYEFYIGKVGQVPRIPEEISLKKSNEPDPCDPTKTVGTEYVWMYCPPYIETDLKGFSLDKPDDPNDLEAPKLIRRESENKVLKVPVTINNIVELFKCPKTGNPSTYEYIWDKIIEQHGNKRIPAGWICMRKNVIGRNQSFARQQALAKESGVVIPQLLQRILFNFMEHVRSRRANVYPDGQYPYTFARTSTLTPQGNDWPSGCGGGGPLGLRVNDHSYDYDCVGVAVALPAEEVQAIGP